VPGHKKHFRFSLGSAADPCSSIWRIWTQGDEAYVAVRNMITVAKLSLHSSGYWQFRADDLIADYRRPLSYRHGWTRGPGIIIPHNPLDLRLPYYDPVSSDLIHWLAPPAEGSMAQFALHFAAPDLASGSWSPDGEPGVELLASLNLRTDGQLCVFRSDRPITPDEHRRIVERRAILEANQPTEADGPVYGLSIISMEPDTGGQPLMFETQVRPLRSAA
jgi:hypothetical protein